MRAWGVSRRALYCEEHALATHVGLAANTIGIPLSTMTDTDACHHALQSPCQRKLLVNHTRGVDETARGCWLFGQSMSSTWHSGAARVVTVEESLMEAPSEFWSTRHFKLVESQTRSCFEHIFAFSNGLRQDLRVQPALNS